MSDAKRWQFPIHDEPLGSSGEEDYVLASDYDAIADELIKERQERYRLRSELDNLIAIDTVQRAELARLSAENEKLQKAIDWKAWDASIDFVQTLQAKCDAYRAALERIAAINAIDEFATNASLIAQQELRRAVSENEPR